MGVLCLATWCVAICAHVPQHSLSNKIEQEQRPIWFYNVIRADTQVSAKHGDLLFWVVMWHWFVVGYRRFGMVNSAALLERGENRPSRNVDSIP
jgi:hypothetical protein